MEQENNDHSLLDATSGGDLDDQLRTLALVLADAIDMAEGHGKAALCRVYLDVLREIREVSGSGGDGAVDAIIASAAGPNARRLSVV